MDPICPPAGNVSSLGVESRVVLASSGIGCVVNYTTPRMIAVGRFFIPQNDAKMRRMHTRTINELDQSL